MLENEYREEQNRKKLLPKLYRVWKTVNKMMEDRKYVVDQAFKEMNFDDWLTKNNNKCTLNGLFHKVDEKNPEIISRLYYEYLDSFKINANDISTFFSQMKSLHAESGIIIISGNLTSQAKQKLIDINHELLVQCYKLSELMVNITEHTYVPKHVVLSNEEKTALLRRYKIKENQLPKILSSDPIARYLGLRRGNVVKIIRGSETSGQYVTYRFTL